MRREGSSSLSPRGTSGERVGERGNLSKNAPPLPAPSPPAAGGEGELFAWSAVSSRNSTAAARRSARLLTFGTPSHSVLAHMNVIRFTDPQFAAQVRRLTSASSLFDPTIEERTRAIVEAVRTRGDAALVEFKARFAGCPEIVVCTPCNAKGAISPALLFAARSAGATEIYRLGGAQAIAAMACGTATLQPVNKIFGPGNAYVVAAKRLLFGRVAIDLLPGPSEVLVLADDTAEPSFIAADLLAQAEHGSGHERVWLVTSSSAFLRAVQQEIARQLPGLSRRDFITAALQNNGWLIQVQSLESAIALVNQLAPEHCEVMTRNAGKVAAKIVTAGAIFLGPFSPTVLGDYVAGPSHTLPTGGAGASFGGLTVDQFQRRTSVVEYTLASLRRSLKPLMTFAEVEGLDAHGRSAALRARSQQPKVRPRIKAVRSRSR